MQGQSAPQVQASPHLGQHGDDDSDGVFFGRCIVVAVFLLLAEGEKDGLPLFAAVEDRCLVGDVTLCLDEAVGATSRALLSRGAAVRGTLERGDGGGSSWLLLFRRASDALVGDVTRSEGGFTTKAAAVGEIGGNFGFASSKESLLLLMRASDALVGAVTRSEGADTVFTAAAAEEGDFREGEGAAAAAALEE